jgi:hypothetical protein
MLQINPNNHSIYDFMERLLASQLLQLLTNNFELVHGRKCLPYRAALLLSLI